MPEWLSLGDLSAALLAAVGLLGWYTSSKLSKRGQRNQEKQGEVANKLAERVQAFEELREVSNSRAEEIERLQGELRSLRTLLVEMEESGNRRLSEQGARCRTQLEALIAAVTTLRGVVLSEIASAATQDILGEARAHLDDDHPDPA